MRAQLWSISFNEITAKRLDVVDNKTLGDFLHRQDYNSQTFLWLPEDLFLKSEKPVFSWNKMYQFLMAAVTHFHKLGGLKQRSLTVKEGRSTESHHGGRKPVVTGPCSLCRLYGRTCSSLPASGSFSHFLVCGTSPQSLPLWSHCLLLFCLHQISLYLPLIRTLVFAFRAHPHNPGYLSLSKYLITFAKSLPR